MSTFFKTLPVRITDEERIAFGNQSAREVVMRAETEDAKKQSMEMWKGKLAAHDNQIARISRIVDSGVEYREVECEKRLRFVEGIVQIVRLDTGEIVDTRPMTSEEAQTRMAFADEMPEEAAPTEQ